MYGRFSYIKGDPAQLDQVIDYTRGTVLPYVDAQPGCYGLGAWVNRQTGDALALSVWADEESMNATETPTTDHRSQAASILGGPAVVDRMEVLLVDQAAPDEVGCVTRLIQMTGDPANVEADTQWARDTIVPTLRKQPGYLGYALAVDRAGKKGVAMTTFRTAADAQASLEAAGALFEQAAARGITFTSMTDYEVAVVGIHAPATVTLPGPREAEQRSTTRT